MRLNEMRITSGLTVDGYGPDFFRVGGTVHQGGVLVAPDGVQPWAGVTDYGPLLSVQGQVDVLLVGMGADIRHPPKALQERMDEIGLGLEVMSSASAARTYNILLSEGRRIAVALIPVGTG